MTSSGHYRRRVGDNDDEQTGARFFKIILQSTIRDKKLLVPRKFIRDSADCLLYSKSATLKVPSGDEWEVELGREGEEDVWFGNNGWQRFAEFYSLQYGHLLVFEYSGRSEFSVVIFGRSATEIDYPVREVIGIEDSAPVLEVLVSDDEDDAGATNQWKENEKGKSPMVPNGAGQGDDNRLVKRQKSYWKSSGEVEANGGGLNKTVMPQEEKQGSSDKPSSSRKRRALPVDGFTTKQPSYQTTMHPSYIATGPVQISLLEFLFIVLQRGLLALLELTPRYPVFSQYIPAEFADEHIKKTEQQVKLVVGGNEWTVRLNKLQNKYMKLGIGWKDFAVCNSLKRGDVCTFELVHGWTDVELKVTIARDPI
ncbi:unnamed protein product [Linum tenue]|uniref:TF-B3 domain-containing protein n=1 Tax=Linum tenue TaxID=586396 RepID=A0AAV0QAL5_9ROSI|nr:unnamed protein product [Linum tenue]